MQPDLNITNIYNSTEIINVRKLGSYLSTSEDLKHRMASVTMAFSRLNNIWLRSHLIAEHNHIRHGSVEQVRLSPPQTAPTSPPYFLVPHYPQQDAPPKVSDRTYLSYPDRNTLETVWPHPPTSRRNPSKKGHVRILYAALLYKTKLSTPHTPRTTE